MTAPKTQTGYVAECVPRGDGLFIVVVRVAGKLAQATSPNYIDPGRHVTLRDLAGSSVIV